MISLMDVMVVQVKRYRDCGTEKVASEQSRGKQQVWQERECIALRCARLPETCSVGKGTARQAPLLSTGSGQGHRTVNLALRVFRPSYERFKTPSLARQASPIVRFGPPNLAIHLRTPLTLSHFVSLCASCVRFCELPQSPVCDSRS